MLRRSPINYLLSLFMLASTAFAATPVEFTDLSKPILVTPKDPVITLNIPGNPTTGYLWVLQDNYNREMIRPIKYAYSTANKALVGGGGMFQFTFRVLPDAFVVPKLLQPLHFVYLRPWENGQAKSLDVQIITSH